MNEDLREAIHTLLREVTPSQGVVVLLCRHPFGNVYYPLAIYISQDLPTARLKPLLHYYLFSIRLEEKDLTDCLIPIASNSPADILLQHGKLAVHLFDKASLRVRFRPYEHDLEKNIVLAVIDSADAGTQGPRDTLLKATVHVARGWADASERLLAADGTTAEEIIASVRNLLDDIDPDPPFFPVLHAHVEAHLSASDTPAGACGSNPLAYNCALLSLYEKLRTGYIDDMFVQAQSKQWFPHPIPAGADSLAEAVAQVCDDYVCKIAVARSGAMLCARFNVPKELVSKAKEKWSQLGDRAAQDDSDWNLVKRGINELVSGDDFSALITVWVGQMDGGGNVKYAFPVGFAPGKQRHYLGNIAKASKLASRRELISSDNHGIAINIVRLEEKPGGYWLKAKNLIKQLANVAEQRIEALKKGFPPPYVLNFQGKYDKTGVPRPLLLTCGDPSVEAMSFGDQDAAYLIYHLLCQTKLNSDGLVTHTMLKEVVFNNAEMTNDEISHKFDDLMRQPFRKRGFESFIDGVVKNKKRHGWHLGKQVTVVGVTRDMLERIKHTITNQKTNEDKAAQED